MAPAILHENFFWSDVIINDVQFVRWRHVPVKLSIY